LISFPIPAFYAFEMRTVWITGAGGLIGNYLFQEALRSAAYGSVVGIVRDRSAALHSSVEQGETRAPTPAPGEARYCQLDLTDFDAVQRRFKQAPPQLIIHCAALSRSPICQENPALARRLNVEVTRHLAELASEIPLIFFSSDLIFDGRQGYYDELATPNPLSVYAETKIAAEQIVLANPRHTVIRISLNGGISPTSDRGFNEEMRRAWQAGRVLKLFFDEFRCPLPAVVTARAVWELAAQNASGIFHLAGSERLSRFQMGELVAARCPQLTPRYERASIKDYHGAPRPADTSLNCSRIQRLLSFRLPGLGEWLAANPHEPF
jgi:dTDP-4-dehydrorhamnose reductase